MKIYIGADHRGYELKEKLAAWLEVEGYNFEDKGAFKLDPEDDYTVYAEKVATMVADTLGKGILLCGSGVGVDVVANKFDGVRSSIGKNEKQIAAGRADDDMNILVIAADYTKLSEAKKMIKAFLTTKFSGKARHKRRLSEIEKIEANN
jgi:ribose 5-phosphate isomerase B